MLARISVTKQIKKHLLRLSLRNKFFKDPKEFNPRQNFYKFFGRATALLDAFPATPLIKVAAGL